MKANDGKSLVQATIADMGIDRKRGRDVHGIADIAPESVLLAGAGRAILLQLAHPAVGHGVARHSDFARDPMKRFHGTLRYIYSLTNGTPEQAAAARAWVDGAHKPVRSAAAADGSHPAYDARDPSLQLWVAATLYDSAAAVRDAVLPPLTPDAAEAQYRDYAVLGTALQMPEGAWPATRAEFAAYMAGMLQTLRVDDAVASVARELLAAHSAPAWARALMPLARLLTAGLLTPELRAAFGLPWSARRDRAFRTVMAATAVIYPRLPQAVRHAPMRYYLRTP